MSEENQITPVTRQRVFDEQRLSNVEWAGRIDEDKFLFLFETFQAQQRTP